MKTMSERVNITRTLIGAALYCGIVLGVSAENVNTNRPAPEGHKLNWHKWADVRTAPSMENPGNLNDGDIKTGGHWGAGPEIGGELMFSFPKPVNVTSFRFIQVWRTATKYSLAADTTGDGNFNEVIKVVTDKEPVSNEWIGIPVDKTVFGLKFVTLEGKAGYRVPYPSLGEVELYTREKIASETFRPEKARCRLTLGENRPYPKFTKRDIDISVSADVWMAGLVADGRNLPEDGNLETIKAFPQFLKRLKEIDANSVRIFCESACCGNKMYWKSKLCPDIGKDLLKAYVDALHKHGYKAYIFLHAWISPLQQEDKMAPMPWRRWDYPYEQSERLLSEFPQYYKVKYPCVVSENDFRSKWTGILKECMDNGVDGVFVMPDEYYFKGHRLGKADCPACRKGFKKRFGYDDMPGKREDTEQYRKWKLFEYEKISNVFSEVAKALRKAKRDVKLVSCANQALAQVTNQRLEHGVCLDILGKDKAMDIAQVYGNLNLDFGGKTAFMKRFEAAFGPNRLLGSVQWLDVKGKPVDFPLTLYGKVLSMVMNGADGIENYRLSYMHDTGWWDNAVKCFKMVRLLEQWDIGKSVSPRSVCLLLSRASEDWWQVKAEAMLDEKADKKAFHLLYAEEEMGTVETKSADERQRMINFERFRGMYAARHMEGLLTENGIPYDARFSDRADTLNDLKKYRLIILPFSYSMSREAFKALKKAVDAGTKVLIYNQLAPTDEYGTDYEAPLLKSLLGHGNVIFVGTNLAAEGMRRKIRQENIDLITALLGDTGFYFNANDAKVEYIVRKIDPGTYVLYVANWERTRTVSPVIGLPLPKGTYRMTVCAGTADNLNQGLLNGKTTASTEELTRFSVALKPGTLNLIRITPAR